MTETSTTSTDEAPAAAHRVEARASKPAGCTPSAPTGPTTPSDRQARWALTVCFAVLYVFFFQGGGWNQNARFDTMRALVEHGTFEIGAYAANTGDLAAIEGRVYANKAPGLAVIGAPVYAVVLASNRMLGLDPDAPAQIERNAWGVTAGVSGSAAVAVLLLLYGWFRQEGATVAEASLLVMAFGAGSLLLPYSGVLMSHAVSALLLLAPWLLIERGPTRAWHWHAAGWMLGLGITVEFLAAPAAAICLVWAIAQRPPPRTLLALVAGCAIPVAGLLLHNMLCFGGPFVSNYSAQSAQFRDTRLALGVLDWPDVRRLYWLTLHPYRGLFYAAPLLFLPLASAFITRGAGRARAGTLAAVAIIASYLLFNLSFNGWTGGYCVGPRYLVPVTPLLFLFALPAVRQVPRFALGLACVSATFMFAVTSVDVMVPGPNSGPPPAFDPIARSIGALAAGDVATNRQGFTSRKREGEPADRGARNLGMSLGLSGTASVVPAAAWLLLCAGWMRRRFGVSKNETPAHTPSPDEGPIAAPSSGDQATGADAAARTATPRERVIGACVLIGAATAFMAPMLMSRTLPPGDDLPFALQLTRSVADGLAWGTPWPRWVDEMNASLGGPALAVYPPLGAWLGGLFSFLSGSLVAGMQTAAWLGAVGAAFAFAFAVRPWCRLRTAVFAAALYVLLPYHFVDQYPRFAFAETLAFAFVPLAFRFARTIALGGAEGAGDAVVDGDANVSNPQRSAAGARSIVGRLGLPAVGLACSGAALLVTHALTAALVALALAVYVGVSLWPSRPRETATRLGVLLASGLLAGALAAFQVGPMLAEQPNLQADALTAVEHGAVERNFLFRDETALGFTQSHIKPFVEAATIPTALLALAAGTLALRRRGRSGARRLVDPIRHEAISMGVTAAWVLLLQLPISAWLWRALPLIERVQFPWRFGVVLAMATAWLFACLAERWLDDEASASDAASRSSERRGFAERGVVAVLVLWALGVGFHATTARATPESPTWFDAVQLRERIVPEYLPPGTSVANVASWARSRPARAGRLGIGTGLDRNATGRAGASSLPGARRFRRRPLRAHVRASEMACLRRRKPGRRQRGRTAAPAAHRPAAWRSPGRARLRPGPRRHGGRRGERHRPADMQWCRVHGLAKARHRRMSHASDVGGFAHAICRSRWALPLLILGAYLSLGLGYLVSVPIFEAPDEPSHLEYIVFLAEEGRLPGYGARPDVSGEGMQPPLYYLLALPSYLAVRDAELDLRSELHRVNDATYHSGQPSPGSSLALNSSLRPAPRGGIRRFVASPPLDRLRGVRLTSLAMGALALWLTWLAGLRATGRPDIAGLTACIVAFNPQFLFVSGAISNDTTATAVGAGSLLLVVAALDGRTASWRLYLATAALGAFGLATKMSTLPPLLVSGLIVWQRDARSLTRRANDLMWATLLFAVLAGPLLVLNTVVKGDPLGNAAFWQSSAHLPRPAHWGGVVPWLATRYWHWTLESYWARFGWFDLAVPRSALAPYVILVAGGLWGALRTAFAGNGHIRDREGADAEAARAVSPVPPRALVRSLAAVTGVAWAAHLWWNMHVAQAQGRHLFVVAPQLAMLLALGWSALAVGNAQRSRMVASTIAIAMWIAACACLFGVIRPAYS